MLGGMGVKSDWCCKTPYQEWELKEGLSAEEMKIFDGMNVGDDKDQLGENAMMFAACGVKMMNDGWQRGRKVNGPINDVWAPKKGWNFLAKLSDGTISGADVEIWAAEHDQGVPRKVSEHNHKLIPGSTLNIARGLGHCGVAYPVFVTERFASPPTSNAPWPPSQMQMSKN